MDNTGTDANANGRPRLRRALEGRFLGGVAAGLAEYLDLDVALVRIGFVALCFLGGAAIPLYVAGWLFIPDEGTDVTIADDLWRHAPAR
jgi:phage shock protein C